jgi:BTB/POZ domain
MASSSDDGSDTGPGPLLGAGSQRGNGSGVGRGRGDRSPDGGAPPPVLARGGSAPHSIATQSQQSQLSSSSNTSSPLLDRIQKDEVVKLNVGGKRYVTTRNTIMSKGENLLTQLISHDSGPFEAARDPEGYLFIDRDGKAFAVILNFLRTGKLLPPPGMSVDLIRMELDYFQLLTEESVTLLFSSAASTPAEGRSRSNTNSTDHLHDFGEVRIPRATEFLAFTEKMRRTAAEWMNKNAETMTHMLMDKARSDHGGVMNHPVVIQFSSRGKDPKDSSLTAICTCEDAKKRIQCVMPDINGLFLRQLEQALQAFVTPFYMCFIDGRRASGTSHVQCKFVAQPSMSGRPNDQMEGLLLALYGRIESWNRQDIKYGGSSLATQGTSSM